LGRWRWAAALACALWLTLAAAASADPTLPPGFDERSVLDGLNQPTAVKFAPDGRVFVAEKEGQILVFDGFDDDTPEMYADLRKDAFGGGGDRGLLDLELDPDFEDNGYVYVIYTYSAPVGEQTPYYGDFPDAYPDYCNHDRCDVSGRVERLHENPGGALDRKVLIKDEWCQEYPSHSIGSLAFDADGNLLAGGGDGADFNTADYGQHIPNPNDPDYKQNLCGDPPGEGGSLRSQDLRTAGDPLGLNGSIIRIDPATGDGVAGNPMYDPAHPDTNSSRIVAYGMRNPFRFAVSPTDGQVWLGDVGWMTWEEIDSFDPSAAQPTNLGWPCYEGVDRQPQWDALDLSLCENLYADDGDGTAAVKAPDLQYSHFDGVYPEDPCPVPGSGSAVSGVVFYDGATFPSEYDNGFFFTDYARACIWWAPAGAGGEPDLSQVAVFDQGVAAPVGLEVGPDGALYYPDIALGEVHRIQHSTGNRAPVAKATATPSSGPLPLNVQFDALASGNPSTDPDPGDTLSFAWDLDGDGDYDDSTAAAPAHTYAAAAVINVGLQVSDDHGLVDADTVRIDAGNSPPVATITAPSPTLQWATGDPLHFEGSATDPNDGAIDPSHLVWKVDLHHCVPGGGCHIHPLVTAPDVDEFEIPAPDHYYPAYVSATLTATDAGGLSHRAELDLQPATVALTARTQPAGLQVALDGVTGVGPLNVTAIKGSNNSVSTTAAQTLGASSFAFRDWSDGGSRAHDFLASANKTLTANFDDVTPAPTGPADPTDPTDPDPPPGSEPPPPPDTDQPIPDPVALEVIRVKLPKRASKLADNGARALVRCSEACKVTFSLHGEGARARRLGLVGELGRGHARFVAGTSGWVTVSVRGAIKRQLASLSRRKSPRIVARFEAKPRN
jgi:glucose/arabinose dehydrogenase/PKD repeat protein